MDVAGEADVCEAVVHPAVKVEMLLALHGLRYSRVWSPPPLGEGGRLPRGSRQIWVAYAIEGSPPSEIEAV
jgi:hypothetical protein